MATRFSSRRDGAYSRRDGASSDSDEEVLERGGAEAGANVAGTLFELPPRLVTASGMSVGAAAARTFRDQITPSTFGPQIIKAEGLSAISRLFLEHIRLTILYLETLAYTLASTALGMTVAQSTKTELEKILSWSDDPDGLLGIGETDILGEAETPDGKTNLVGVVETFRQNSIAITEWLANNTVLYDERELPAEERFSLVEGEGEGDDFLGLLLRRGNERTILWEHIVAVKGLIEASLIASDTTDSIVEKDFTRTRFSSIRVPKGVAVALLFKNAKDIQRKFEGNARIQSAWTDHLTCTLDYVGWAGRALHSLDGRAAGSEPLSKGTIVRLIFGVDQDANRTAFLTPAARYQAAKAACYQRGLELGAAFDSLAHGADRKA